MSYGAIDLAIKAGATGDAVLPLARQFQAFINEEPALEPAGLRPGRAPRKVAPSGEQPPAADPIAVQVNEPQDETDRELLADVPPAPNTANAVVDAGTGQPVAAQPTVKMTMADVKSAAAKLAAKDTPALAALLKKYDAPNLSGIAPERLPDFVAEVMAAIG